VLVSGTNGIIVATAAADVVTLRGLTIEGVGTGLSGILFNNSGTLHVENCYINGFTQRGIDFVPTSAGANLFVTNTTVRNNGVNNSSGGGILVKPSGGVSVDATITGSRLAGNRYGVRAEDGGLVTVRDSTATESVANGFVVFSSGGTVRMALEGTATTNNVGIGLRTVNPGASAYISNVISTGNATGLSPEAGSSIVSWGNNRIGGNTIDGAPSSMIVQK
jgi:hypothetical protein